MRPTREGRTGANRAGLIFKGLGVDPDTETEDPEPPPDQAAAMSGAQATVAYLPPPDPGTAQDLNLIFGTDYDGGGNRAVTDPTFANDGDISTLAGRLSFFNGGGTKTWYLEADLGAAFDVDQIVVRGGFGNAGENDPSWSLEHSPDSSTWTAYVGTYTWDGGTSPRTATIDLTSTQTKRYWRIGQTITYSGLIYPLKVHTWQINGDPGAVDPTNIIFIEGPLTIDDDDTTYEQVLTDAIADEVWRVTLLDSYLISSINLRIAFENAGAVTLELQAGNESDYSDAATIATLTATGTGSFTAQDITASFSPTAVYQYWQLLLTSTAQDIHIHTVNLFGPTEPTGVHGDLTGLSDVDQHPASSITFTPSGTIAATNVQDAIEEVATEGGGGGSGPYEFDYAQITSPVNVTATTEATANTIITGNAVTYDGSTVVVIEAFFPYWTIVNNSDTQLWLYDGSSSIGTMALMSAVTATGITGTQRQHVKASRRLTPSAAAHTYSLRGTTSTGTAVAGAAAGGAGNHPPAYIRITKSTGSAVSDHTHAVTGSGATGGGGTLNVPSLNATGLFRTSGQITSTIDADQNNWAPTGIHTNNIIYFNSFTANRTITGIDAGSNGEVLILQNNTAFSLLLPHESASSTASNRFRNPNSGTVTVRTRGSVYCVYIQGRWCPMVI